MLKLYEVVIKPVSLFGTPLAGDTIFGHLCWQFAYDASLLQKEFTYLVREYCKEPFIIVSSAVPRISLKGVDGYAVPRPDLSLFTKMDTADPSSRREVLEKRKEQKKRKWLFVDEQLQFHFDEKMLLSEPDLFKATLVNFDEGRCWQAEKSGIDSCVTTSERAHNSINRLTMTTGQGFAPFSLEVISFLPGVHLSIFVMIDDDVCSEDNLRKGFKRIGSFGYGRDASSGLGRFELVDVTPKDTPMLADANACYTLAPCLPVNGNSVQGWFQPMTRFGKHGGGAELTGKPFKNPVVMAAEGAVFRTGDNSLTKPYIGRGVTGVSKAIPETVVQGYSLYLPCRVEV